MSDGLYAVPQVGLYVGSRLPADNDNNKIFVILEASIRVMPCYYTFPVCQERRKVAPYLVCISESVFHVVITGQYFNFLMFTLDW